MPRKMRDGEQQDFLSFHSIQCRDRPVGWPFGVAFIHMVRTDAIQSNHDRAPPRRLTQYGRTGGIKLSVGKRSRSVPSHRVSPSLPRNQAMPRFAVDHASRLRHLVNRRPTGCAMRNREKQRKQKTGVTNAATY